METNGSSSMERAGGKGVVQTLWLLYGVAMVFLVWGFAIGRYEVFPFSILKEVVDFVRGDPLEDTSVLAKLQNDLGGAPRRFLHPRIKTLDDTQYTEVLVADGLFRDSRQPPVFYSSTSVGAYLLYGVFEFADGRYGATLIRHDGSILRHWVFHPPAGNNELNPVKGGFMPNGYVVSNAFHTLQVQDYCGRNVWSADEGNFHHSVEADDDDTMWVLNGFDWERRSVFDGAVTEKLSIFDVMAANAELHIFEPRLLMTDWQISDLGQYTESWPDHEIALRDPFHINDVTPLPQALESAYPAFAAGDLLVSARALNLVFVVRPATRRVLWHTFGKTSRQHDPDFNESGSITIFDNDNHSQFSRIVEMDISNQEVRPIVDGSDLQLSNEAHGNHTYLPDRSILLVDYFGRLIHLDSEGRVLFELQNTYNAEETLELRNVHYLTDSELAAFETSCQ